MGFGDAIKVCFNKYADFNGRAKRPEYWWFFLFTLLVGVATRIVGLPVYVLFALGTLLPTLAVGARRLHDTNRSGYWLLIWIVPLIGWIILIIFLAEEGNPMDNAYGSPPAP